MPTISKIGFCKYKGTLPEGTSIPADIINQNGVQFTFTYDWEGDLCSIIEIKWRPVKIEIVNGERTVTNVTFSETGFKKHRNDQNVIFTIDFNG